MNTSNFWPMSDKYNVHVLHMKPPVGLSESAKLLIQETLVLTDMLRCNQNAQHDGQDQFDELITLRLKAAILSLSSYVTDRDSKLAMQWRARTFEDADTKRKYCEKISRLNEKEIVCYSGAMSTWVGKSRELFYSTFYSSPNEELQYVSDIIDDNFLICLEEFKETVSPDLISLSSCSYKIVDLFASSGEANLYPKHFAYFMPEDEGVKYSKSKRTIVFSNVYDSLFSRISIKQLNLFDWTSSDLPEREKISSYLIAWFRGHDLGHSIVTDNTSFRDLSKLDRWGSMVIQETLADIFGLLLCSSDLVVRELKLDKEKIARVYLLEMLRYLRRGPCEFPDAGSAYVQFKFFVEEGCLRLNNDGEIQVHLEKFFPTVIRLAKYLTENILQDGKESADVLMRKYCPHHDKDSCSQLMSNLGSLSDTIEYEQYIRGL